MNRSGLIDLLWYLFKHPIIKTEIGVHACVCQREEWCGTMGLDYLGGSRGDDNQWLESRIF